MSALPTIGLNVQEYLAHADPVALARWAEDRGYESVWLTDGRGRFDALTMAGAIAATTAHVRIALSIVPVYTRPAAVLATSAAALAHLAPERIVLGVGSSSQTMIEDWYGVPFERPLVRVRETVEALRQILTGAKTDYRGDVVRTRNFRLMHPPPGRLPIYVAALRANMLELAGELADGVILNLVPVQLLPRMLEHVDRGAKRSGRRVNDLEVVSLFNVFVTDDADRALDAMRGIALSYYSTGVYNRFLSWMGYAREAEEIRQGFAARDRDRTRRAMPDELVQQLGVIGPAEQCRDRLREFARAGLDTAVVGAVSEHEADYRATLEAFRPNSV